MKYVLRILHFLVNHPFSDLNSKCIFFLFLVITDSNKTQDLRGQTVVNFNLELLSPQQRKVNLNLSPEEFYNLCLEMEKAKLQLEMILQKVK